MVFPKKSGYRPFDKYNIKYTLNGEVKTAITSFGTKAEADEGVKIIKKERPQFKNPRVVLSSGYKKAFR